MTESRRDAMPYARRDGFIVRIFHHDLERAAGIGFVVGEQQVVTCAHVVNTALGRNEHFQDAPRPEERVRIDFPLLGDDSAGGSARECKVDYWLAPPRQGISGGGDVAGLVIVGGGLPPGAYPSRLILSDQPSGAEVRVFGYGDDLRAEQGAWATLRLRGIVEGGNIQLDAETESAFRPRRGYSGSPVVACSQDEDVVVGMLAVAREGDLTDSYAVPATRIAAAWHAVLGDLLAAAPAAPGEAGPVGFTGQPPAVSPSMPQPVSSPAAMTDLAARPMAQQPTATQPDLQQPSLLDVLPGNWTIDIQLPQGGFVKLMLVLMIPPVGQPEFQGTFLGTPMPMQISGYWWETGSQMRLTGVQTVAAAFPMQNRYDVVVTFASWSRTQLIGVTSNGERVVWQRRD